MKSEAEVYEEISIEEMLEVVREAGHTAELRDNESGRRTLHCEADGLVYAVQFYPNEGHATNAFGAVRFVAWVRDDAPSADVANAYNAKYRFASAFAAEDCYEVQHDIVVIGASDRNLVICTQQWATSLEDFMEFVSEEE